MADAVDSILHKYAPAKDMGQTPDDIADILTKYGVPETKPEQNGGQAALAGFGNMATMGYMPQIQGAVGGLIPDPNAATNEKLQGQGFQINETPNTYVARRDQAISAQDALESNAPLHYLAGGLVGAVATSPMMGGLLGETKGAVGIGSKLLRAGSAGALQGALQNPGDTEGQIDPLQLGSRVENAGRGAALGAGTQGIASAGQGLVGKALGVPKGAQEYANAKAVKSAGFMLKDLRRVYSRDQADDIANMMFDHGMAAPGTGIEDVARISGDLKKQTGGSIGDILDKADQAGQKLAPAIDDSAISAERRNYGLVQNAKSPVTSIDANQIADDLEAQISSGMKGRQGGTSAINAAKTTLDELRQNGPDSSIIDLQNFKADLDHTINYNREISDQPLAKQVLSTIRDEVKNRIQARIESLDGVLGTDDLGALQKANRDYGTLATINKAASDKVVRDAANRSISLTDTIAGTGGVAAGAMIGYHEGGVPGAVKGGLVGAGLGVANNLGRRYGNPAMAAFARKAGRTIEPAADKIGSVAKPAMGLVGNNPAELGASASKFLNPPKNKPEKSR